MNNKQITIIGCGWLGNTLAKKLSAAGNKIYGTATSEESLKNIKAHGATPVLLNLPVISEDAKETGVFTSRNIIISFPPGLRRGDPEDYYAKLEILVNAIDHESRIIFINSTGIYPSENQIASEDDDLPDSPYLKAEKILKSKGNDFISLRTSGLFGGERIIGNMMAGREIAGGNIPVNLIHREDVVEIIVQLINSSYTDEIFNLTCSDHPTKELFYNFICQKKGLEKPVWLPEDKPGKVISNAKIKRLLSYQFIYDRPFDFPEIKN